VPLENGGAFWLRDRDHLYEVRNPSASFRKKILDTGSELQVEGEGMVTVQLRGEVLPPDSGWVVTRDDWKEIPRIGDVFGSRRHWFEVEKPSEVPTRKEWQEFAEAVGGKMDSSGHSKVIYQGRLYEVAPDTWYLDEKIVIPGLTTGRKMAGVVLAVAGLGLLVMLYREPRFEEAIQIGTTGYQIAGDVIVTIFAMLAAVPVVDVLLHEWFGVVTIADEQFIRFMGIFFLIFAIPLVSLYMSMVGSQWFQADEKGVRLRSLFSDRFIPWDEIEEIKTEKTTLFPVMRGGVPLARTLQKSLVFLGTDGRIGVMEPSESVKREVLARAAQHAPQEWKEPLEAAGKKWKGYEVW
jgi:hypothetical protein